jgi:hypothetical protein
MKRCAALAVSLVAMAGVVSCGGGGDDVVSAPAGPSAEGYYAGSLVVTAFPAQPGNPPLPNTSTSFQMLVLESGQFWTIYGTPTLGRLDVEGFAQGTGTSNGSLFIAGNVRYFSQNPATTAVASASYNASAKSISGTITDSSTTATFNSAPLTAPAYNYASAAALSSVQNNWTVTGVFGDLYDLVVLADGTFSGTPSAAPPNPATCPFTGRFVPNTSGKNVFSVSITNGVPGCAVDVQGLTTTGIAFVSPVTGGSQLTFATVDTGRTRGAVLTGIR